LERELRFMILRTCEGSPGPGYWERDNSHFPLSISLHLWELFLPSYDEGARRGLARYGSLIDHFDFARITGRMYSRMRLVAERDEPEIHKRQNAAEWAIATKLWRQDRACWLKERDNFRSRLLEFGRLDPSTMDPATLREHLVALRETFTQGVIQHFAWQPGSMFPVAEWVRLTSGWTGASASEVLSTLQSSRFDTDQECQILGELADVIRSTPGGERIIADAARDPIWCLEELQRVSPEVRQRLDAYLDEYGDRITTGFDITDRTLRELPGVTLSIIKSRVRFASSKQASPKRRSMELELRQRVCPGKRAEFDEWLTEAKVAYGLHDEDVRITYLWPLGLIRRAVLVAADQLVARGALQSAEDVFQTMPNELDALLQGGSRPGAEELSKRSNEWRSWQQEAPPSAFGEKEPYRCGDSSPACARMTSAIAFYISEMETQGQAIDHSFSSVIVEGVGASPGRYEGRARIVSDPTHFGKLAEGDVLVACTTSPTYSVILPILGAVVTDRGGALCHTAIVAREFGIPAVVGTNHATRRIPDGAMILVDGDRGVVELHTG
jgi:phosphohistidine swiveling domain-containing protein